jgi:enediyne biosynthesis protein E4
VIGNMTRRKRYLIITSTLGLLFISILILVFWVLFPKKHTYLPGEEIEGLTADLNRSIPQDYPRVSFIDVSREAGINFQHFYGQRSIQLPEDMGSGAAWGDYDNDGWLDLFVANEVGPLSMGEDQIRNSPAHSALYHNQGDGTFIEVSAQAGVDLRAWAISPAWGDYDNDGALDLFVSCYGFNRLYHNNGDGTFSDESTKAGMDEREGFWAGASWGDFNRDGFIDLYVCGYVQYSGQEDQVSSLQYDVEVPASINPSSFKPERNLLFLNNQDGSFSEIAKKAGVDDKNGRSLSAAWCDFDDDGWPDIYVANDVSDNVLYRNSGDNTFEEISHSALVADYRGAMGVAVGDWDNDNDMDMFITHWIAQENALYNNMRSHFLSLNSSMQNEIKFMDEADRYGLGQIGLDYIGWGTSFFDYDNDSKLDLFVVNGSTFQQKQNPRLLTPMADQLFWNQGKEEGFYDVSTVSGKVFNKQYVGRGAAFGDYDNDGDMDIFIVNNGGPGILLRNEGGNKNNWLKVGLHGVQSNRSAIGTKIRIVMGESIQIRQVGAQSSYCSQNSFIQHFGLGESVNVDTLEINWPAGTKQVFHNLSTNKSLEIVESEPGSSLKK